jgi:uncharacterized protein
MNHLISFLCILFLSFAGCKSNAPEPKIQRILTPAEVEQQKKDNVLFSCVKEGSLECTKKALEQGAKVDGRDAEGNTALISVMTNDPSRVVKVGTDELLSAGYDLRKLEEEEKEIFKREVLQNYEIAEYLIQQGADVNLQNDEKYSALMHACLNQYLDMVVLLIKHQAKIEVQNKFGETPLYLTSIVGNYDIAKLLISKGANVNAKNRRDYTPLMRASSHGYARIADLLIQNKADVNAKSEVGFTALMLASSNGFLNTVKVLLKAKAEINTKNKKGHTAISLAKLNKKNSVVDELKAAGAKE